MANTLKLGAGNWATKVGSTLAYNDEGGNFKPLPVNFTRSTSATRVNKEGLIEVVANNKPRIDFLNDSNGALLLEPQRMNLVQYSQDFSNSAWNTSSTRGVNFIPTSTIDPQGKTNAYRMTSTASDNQVAYLATIVLGRSYSSSIYVKRVSGSGDVILRDVNNVENNFQVSVNDGWKRLETSVLSTSTNGRLYINLQTVGDVIEIWGAQLELGSYATSIIPTQGSQVTRVQDICNGAGNSQLFNGSEGVLFVEMSVLANDSTYRRITLRDSSFSNQVRIGFGSSPNSISGVLSNGTNQAVINTTSNNILNFNKIAFKYKQNDFALWVNGVKVGTDIIGNTIVAGVLDRIDLSIGGNKANIKQIQYFDTALTESELQALTTI